MPDRDAARSIAYFSMEIALESHIPTYSGGLGVLAGDTLRSAADLGLPMVAVTLLYRKGYFDQRLDGYGRQHEDPVAWSPSQWLESLPASCEVEIEGRPVRLQAWRYLVKGVGGAVVPVYLLDTDLPENDPYDRSLSGALYGGDDRYRLCQEVVLGIGGCRMLRALGHDQIERYHMNEGHSALLALELAERERERAPSPPTMDELRARVRQHCVFTTHTPVA